jgi:RimJ/RimL family protein N-acetyltransferase
MLGGPRPGRGNRATGGGFLILGRGVCPARLRALRALRKVERNHDTGPTAAPMKTDSAVRRPRAALSATAESVAAVPVAAPRLRPVVPTDLDRFFEHQRDPLAVRMAAFTADDPSDRVRFDAHWSRILADPAIVVRTIVLADGEVAGHVLTYEQFGDREVSYWIAREHWGQGIATRALSQFLRRLKGRPLFARTAKDNLGSLRVLQKCGFAIVGEDKGYAGGRGAETEEYILRLGG